MKRKNWVSLLAFILLLLAIFFGGPIISKLYDRNYRSVIDKNGVITKAVIYDRKTYKGKTIHFSYSYNGLEYSNNEQSECLFYLLNIRDTIIIKVDSTQPQNSYILEPACK